MSTRTTRRLSRRSLSLLAAGAVAAPLLAACGSSGSSSANGSGAATASEATSTSACNVTPPAKSTTVNLLVYSSPSIDPLSNAMVACSKVKNLHVEHSPLSFSAEISKANLSLSQSSNGSYDVVEVYTGTLPKYAAKGWIQPLDSLISQYSSKYQLDQIDQRLLKFFSYDGHVYGLPAEINAEEFIYRKDIFQKLGLTPPTTMAELVSDAQKIKASGDVQYPLALDYGASENLTTTFNDALTSLGGAWIDPQTDQPELNSPAAGKALESLKSLLPYMPPTSLAATTAAIESEVENGSVAMTVLYSGDGGALSDSNQNRYASKMGFAGVPSVEQGGGPFGTLSIDGFAMAKNSSVDPSELFQVMANGASPAAIQAAGVSVMPARSNLQSTPPWSNADYIKAAQASLNEGEKAYPAKPYFVAIQTAVKPTIAEYLEGKISEASALSTMQSEASAAIAQSK